VCRRYERIRGEESETKTSERRRKFG